MPARQHKYKSAWGTFVQYLLDLRKISHSDLAERLGVTQGAVSHYISGRSKPPLGELTRWAEAMRATGEEAERLSWLALETWTPEPVKAIDMSPDQLAGESDADWAKRQDEIARRRFAGKS